MPLPFSPSVRGAQVSVHVRRCPFSLSASEANLSCDRTAFLNHGLCQDNRGEVTVWLTVVLAGCLAIRGGPAEKAEMAMARRTCRTPGCNFQILGRRHRHCCSLCNSLNPAQHGERCLALQNLLANSGPHAWTPGVCQTAQCGREANWGYRSCCSTCFRTRGQRHSSRCQAHIRTGTAGGIGGTHYTGPRQTDVGVCSSAHSDTVLVQPNARGHHGEAGSASALSSSSRAQPGPGQGYVETNMAMIVVDLISDDDDGMGTHHVDAGDHVASTGAVPIAVAGASLPFSGIVLDEMD